MSTEAPGLADFARFCGRVARSAFAVRLPPGAVIEEAWRIGVLSMPVLLVISVFVGTNLSIQGYSAFSPLGGQQMVGMFVALAGVRELAPILAAAMVAAKAGTEMASQLAVMRSGEQIDALEVMAVDPYAWLVTPRILGILAVMPALTTISIGVTVLAAWAVAVHQLHLNGDLFLQLVQQSIQPLDLIAGVLKALFFGLYICLVSCFFGFHSQKGPEGVGRATNLAVVVSSVGVLSINAVISQVLYGG
jgi:phospholipid/cholesterol/gamma-HCH transport system permease protein